MQPLPEHLDFITNDLKNDLFDYRDIEKGRTELKNKKEFRDFIRKKIKRKESK
jgi:hypothetical protein